MRCAAAKKPRHPLRNHVETTCQWHWQYAASQTIVAAKEPAIYLCVDQCHRLCRLQRQGWRWALQGLGAAGGAAIEYTRTVGRGLRATSGLDTGLLQVQHKAPSGPTPEIGFNKAAAAQQNRQRWPSRRMMLPPLALGRRAAAQQALPVPTAQELQQLDLSAEPAATRLAQSCCWRTTNTGTPKPNAIRHIAASSCAAWTTNRLRIDTDSGLFRST